MTTRSPSQYEGAVIEGTISSVNASGRAERPGGHGAEFRDHPAAQRQDVSVRRRHRERAHGRWRDHQRGQRRQGRGRSSQTEKTVQVGAIGAALGAIIGAISGGGKAAAIGAAIGAAGGAGTVIAQGRDQLDLPRGTELTITSSLSDSPASVERQATIMRWHICWSRSRRSLRARRYRRRHIRAGRRPRQARPGQAGRPPGQTGGARPAGPPRSRRLLARRDRRRRRTEYEQGPGGVRGRTKAHARRAEPRRAAQSARRGTVWNRSCPIRSPRKTPRDRSSRRFRKTWRRRRSFPASTTRRVLEALGEKFHSEPASSNA